MSTDPLRHLNPGAIPVHAVLAVASLAIGLAEVVAAGSGSPTAPPTAVILLALAATFGVAARARHEGRSAAAARLTAGAILVATPLLAVIYPAEAGVELGAPIMFLVLLPHLEGIATVAFAAATVAVTASLPILGALDNGGRPIAEAVGSATGLLTASSLLVALTWASQRATRAASRRYEDLVADVPVGIARVSVDGRFLEVNDAYAKMLGYPSREALLATPVLAVYADPADRRRLVEAANARGQLRVELPLRRLDGSTVWARIGTRVSRDTAGNPRWYDGAIEDITAEREAASARERLAAIVEAAGDAIYATSLDGTVLSWNAAAERIYGWTTGEVLGRAVFSFTARSEHGLIRQRLGRIARGERVGPLDASRVRRNGSPLTLSVVISPLRDGAGSVVGASVVERDVTKQRATEGRLERLRHERALVVDALRSLRPGATVEETADAICTEISRTGFGHAVVLGWESADRLAFLASRIDGRPAPTMRGLIEPDRARLLDERTAAGPWVDAVNPADPNPHRAALAGAGVRALSYSAIVHEGKRVGILVVGAPGVDVNRLSERLTALAEFAAICGQLLGPGLRERRLRSRAREEISAIIASGAFEPVFQPIVALESGATVGFEALTRFTDGRSADEVFAAAVRAEVGLDLELATLRAALSDAVALPRRAFLDVNVSPELVLAGDELATIVASSALDLVLEITEHTEISDYRRFREAVGSLPRTRLAIDDAGAGFASLRHVAELAPASVKLDRSLVHGIDRDPVRRALVTGMVHFADGVGCTLVAEGVETPEERAALLDLGVRFGQGFLLGRPRPVAAFAESSGPASSAPAGEGTIVSIGPRLVAIDGLGRDVAQQNGARRGVTKRVASGGTIGS